MSETTVDAAVRSETQNDLGYAARSRTYPRIFPLSYLIATLTPIPRGSTRSSFGLLVKPPRFASRFTSLVPNVHVLPFPFVQTRAV